MLAEFEAQRLRLVVRVAAAEALVAKKEAEAASLQVRARREAESKVLAGRERHGWFTSLLTQVAQFSSHVPLLQLPWRSMAMITSAGVLSAPKSGSSPLY